MRRSARLSVVTAAAGLAALIAAPGALAQETAEYTRTGDAAVSSRVATAPRPAPAETSARTSLPLTGGEVVLVAAAGAAALVAGGAMVAGGRRRSGTDS
jgi:LPXTG-motif cell wall-anchored protein